MMNSFWIKKVRRYLAKKLPKEDKRAKKKNLHKIKKVLLGRLKLLSYILLAFSALFFLYSLNLPSSSETLSVSEVFMDPCEEKSAHETLNFFLISLVFLSLGLFCLFTIWKNDKKKKK